MRLATGATVLLGLLLLSGATLISFARLPDFGFWNSAAAVIGVQLLAAGLLLANTKLPRGEGGSGLQAAYAAIGVYAGATVWSFASGAIPYPGVALQTIGAMVMLALAVWVGVSTATNCLQGHRALGALAPSLVLAVVTCVGVVQSLIGLAQVSGFSAPGIAYLTEFGRAYGNIRQSNQYAFVLFTGMISAAELFRRGRIPALVLALLMFLHTAGMVASGSRTGMVLVGLFLAWLVWERLRHADNTRALSASVAGILAAAALAATLVKWTGLELRLVNRFAGTLASGEFDGSRFQVWTSALKLLLDAPLTGVGVGGVRFALAFGPYPIPPRSNFDNLHNLPLQLLVELGLPLGLLMLALVAWALWSCRHALSVPAGRSLAVWMTGLLGYSLVEFPLWSMYFLLPAGIAVGVCLVLGHWARRQIAANPPGESPDLPPRQQPDAFRRGLLPWLALLLTVAMQIWLMRDYMKLSPIYDTTKAHIPLTQRMAEARSNFWFVHHAHYSLLAQPQLKIEDPQRLDLLCRLVATQVADETFMFRYAIVLIAAGEAEKAVFLASRLQQQKSVQVAALAQFVRGSTLPAAQEVSRYLANPQPVSLPMNRFR
jgi:hypothetical protein